jgi:hypothetical protein
LYKGHKIKNTFHSKASRNGLNSILRKRESCRKNVAQILGSSFSRRRWSEPWTTKGKWRRAASVPTVLVG